LGTLAGLYESAIDMLCSSSGVRPKVVASTATIRNAASQIRGLFDRKFCQFPPPLIDARDSFFAKEDTNSPSRKYVGIFNPGVSGPTSFIRSTSCILHSPYADNVNDKYKNPYWTFLGYFNSLRELGGARIQIIDDVNAYLKTCAQRDGTQFPREIVDVCELTSRRDGADLTKAREDLSINYGDDECLDAVIATNMISVGLDVPRLGVMSIVGQPKTTAEYIQASSRVGRKFPGLVVTLYNPMRSRDRSHYERFVHYHSRLYAEVEATSVTPWSIRARERALHASFISCVRHLCPSMQCNGDAGSFTDSAKVKEIVRWFVDRAKGADTREGKLTEEMFKEIISQWERMNGSKRAYSTGHKNLHDALLVPFEEPGDFQGFRTMQSMRNVDAAANLYLK
ncbi:helicase-related protein, partial [bacterium]|nr:helicase-related protein [bacterium]